MANTRCFDSVNKSILSASELSSEKRQQTIYTEIQKNVQRFNTANPVKNNGKEYNRNTIVNSTCDISSGYVEVAKSYALLMDVKGGAATCYPVVVSTPIDSIQTNLCSNLCGNTFDSGFQDTGGDNSEVQRVFDASANAHLVNLDTNANKDAFIASLTAGFYAAGSAGSSVDLLTGVNRYRNATFLGSCDTTTYTNPQFVFQFSTSNTTNTWFSDGVEPSYFTASATKLEFCFQRSNVPTRYVRPYFVTDTSLNAFQVILTKN